MNILLIGNFGRGWDGSICDEENIAQALEKLGHQVTRLQRENIELVNRSEYDFTLVAQWDRYNLSILSLLPKPLIYWAFDYQADGQEWHERLVAQADLYLSKRLADSKYPNWRWLSQDFSPSFLYPDNSVNRNEYHQTIDVLFTGSYLPWATERNETLKAVGDKFNLEIYSYTPDAWRERGFKNVNGPLMDHDLPALIHKAKINLAIDHTIEAGYWSDRAAQTMCCQGFVLFRYVPLSETVFRDNVVYFYSIEDCLDKIEYYLKEYEVEGKIPGNIRNGIAARGYRYAHQYLRVDNRVQDLLAIVRSIL